MLYSRTFGREVLRAMTNQEQLNAALDRFKTQDDNVEQSALRKCDNGAGED